MCALSCQKNIQISVKLLDIYILISIDRCYSGVRICTSGSDQFIVKIIVSRPRICIVISARAVECFFLSFEIGAGLGAALLTRQFYFGCLLDHFGCFAGCGSGPSTAGAFESAVEFVADHGEGYCGGAVVALWRMSGELFIDHADSFFGGTGADCEGTLDAGCYVGIYFF